MGRGSGEATDTSRWRVWLLVLGLVVAGVLAAGGLLLALLALRVGAGSPDGATDGITGVDAAASSEGYAVWDRNDDGSPVRWDPCARIEVVLEPTGAPPGATADLAEAVARLRETTGLDLVVVGRTDERPAGRRLPYQPERYGERWAPVLVAWAAPGEGGVPLRDTDRGVAIPIAVGPDGDRGYVTGQVVLNADRRDLVPGFDDRATSWGATLVHELAHVLGLAHVDDPSQLLHVYPGEGPISFGAGDLAGLAAVGDDGTCRPAPTPRPIAPPDPAAVS